MYMPKKETGLLITFDFIPVSANSMTVNDAITKIMIS